MNSRPLYLDLFMLVVAVSTIGGATVLAIKNAPMQVQPSTQQASRLEGHYDPINKVQCYWLEGSKATPACLVVDWPYELEVGGARDE